MKIKNKQIAILLLFGMIMIGYSCKTTKESTSIIALSEMSVEERLNNIISSAVEYNTLSSNLKFAIKPGKKSKEMSIDAQMRIIKNELIQLSFRIPIIGSEAMKVQITPEKIVIIDRINKQCLSESMENIKSNKFDFDFYALEALLTNQLFIAGKKEVVPPDYSTFKVSEDDFFVNIKNTDKQNINYNFISDFSNRIQTTEMLQKEWQSHLVCNYSDWGLTSNKRAFPMSINLSLDTLEDSYQMNLALKEIDVNPNFSVDYNLPNNYKRVTLQDALKLIQRLL